MRQEIEDLQAQNQQLQEQISELLTKADNTDAFMDVEKSTYKKDKREETSAEKDVEKGRKEDKEKFFYRRY